MNQEIMTGEPTKAGNLSLWEFIDSGQLGSLHETDLGALNVCDCCKA